MMIPAVTVEEFLATVSRYIRDGVGQLQVDHPGAFAIVTEAIAELPHYIETAWHHRGFSRRRCSAGCKSRLGTVVPFVRRRIDMSIAAKPSASRPRSTGSQGCRPGPCCRPP
jgi:hypothetical protein